MIIDNKIRHEENMITTAKIQALSSGKNDKYEYLTSE